MKVRVLILALVGVALASGGAWWLQRAKAGVLHDGLAIARAENRELAQIQADNARRRATQPSADEVARLRADHAAVLRLRGEVEALRANIEAREKPNQSH